MRLFRLKHLCSRWLLRIGFLIGVPYLINKLGDGLNLIAINANYGVMPCIPTDCDINETHVLWQSGMHFKVLCDFLHIGAYIVSVGDILIICGLWGTILGIGGLLTLAVHDKFHL